MTSQPDTATLFDHSRFVALREALLDLFDRQAPEADIAAKADELLQHMRQQFAREERAMEAAQFSPCAAHKKDHDRALADFSGHIGHWKLGKDTERLLDYLEAGLADWFVRHVNTRDYITARRLSMEADSGKDRTDPKPAV
jgi:hemerythrin-like metal-binding protein